MFLTCLVTWCFILQLVDKKTFKSPKEFREESQWMFHNAIIYFGGIHQMQRMTSDKFLTSWNLHCLTYSSSGTYQSFDYIVLLSLFHATIFLFPAISETKTHHLLVSMRYCQMLSMKVLWHIWLKFSSKSSHSKVDSNTFFLSHAPLFTNDFQGFQSFSLPPHQGTEYSKFCDLFPLLT